ncbi:MAG: Serine/threonine protein kinase [uncultured Aureispira sp.]|uniref:Serine/threonine protein kinase n=1 Tax=uncultured Aureispira sp. TaxID=1331704 RepID=A0A6S6TRP8_9BACT|nr:MAG: Serine/threonine protein kinase [uncultured Aureispira sp.]
MKVWIQNNNSTPIQLQETPIAGGGEGNLYAIQTPGNYQHLVAKIYHPNRRTALRHQKIVYLHEHPPQKFSENSPMTLVWPQELLFDEDKQFVGFLMPWVAGEKLELLSLPKLPKKHTVTWNDFDFEVDLKLKKRLDLCYKIAASIQYIHQTERYILIDMKPDNIMVTPDGKVALVDLDSVEVVENGETLYDAPVATPEYTPPDSYLENNAVDPTQEDPWDRFGMAVIFYKLLLGIHPYAASAKAPYDQYTSLYQKIEHGLFVHNLQIRPQLSAVPERHERYQKLPVSIQQLFERCFIEGHHKPYARPSAEEWVRVLRTYNLDRNLSDHQIKIPSIALQQIPAHLNLNQLFIVPTTRSLSPAPKIEVKKPIETKELQQATMLATSQDPKKVQSQRFFNFIILLLIIVIAAALSLMLPSSIAIVIGICSYLGFNYLSYRSRKYAEKKDTIKSILNKQMQYFNDLIQTAEKYEKSIAGYLEKITNIQAQNPKEHIQNCLNSRALIQKKINAFNAAIKKEKHKLKALKQEEKAHYAELYSYYNQQIEAKTTLPDMPAQTLRQKIILLKRKKRLGLLDEAYLSHYDRDLHHLEQLLAQQDIELAELEHNYFEKIQDLIYRCKEQHKDLMSDINRYHQLVGKEEEEKIKITIEEQRISLRELERLEYDLQQLEKPLQDQVGACRRAQRDAELYKKVNYGRHLLEMVGLAKPL